GWDCGSTCIARGNLGGKLSRRASRASRRWSSRPARRSAAPPPPGRASSACGDQVRGRFGERGPLVILPRLADVERAHGSEVAHDSGPHLAGLRLGFGEFYGAAPAREVLPGEVAVHGAGGEGGGDGEVGEPRA